MLSFPCSARPRHWFPLHSGTPFEHGTERDSTLDLDTEKTTLASSKQEPTMGLSSRLRSASMLIAMGLSLRSHTHVLGFSGTPCRIKVFGVGGGGSNAVDRMVDTQVDGVDFYSLNTDAQALSRSRADKTLQLGRKETRGLGAGGKPSVGAIAADESRKEIRELVDGADMVFVTAGLGGGTGSGAAPIVAEEAMLAGALTIGVVTKPFRFEGPTRRQNFDAALAKLRESADAVVLVSNDRLLELVPPNTSVEDAFLVCDNVLRQAIVGTSEIVVRSGLINVDFADVSAIMKDAGTCLVGIGTAAGNDRAMDAAIAAVSCPLMEGSPSLRELASGSLIRGAEGVVINVVGGPDLTLQEVQKAADVIQDACSEDANIIFGALIDDSLPPNAEVRVTVLATGFDGSPGAEDGSLFSANRKGTGSNGVEPGFPTAAQNGAAIPTRKTQSFFERGSH